MDGGIHSSRLHEARADACCEAGLRIRLNEELDKLGWTGAELAKRAKGDVRKVRMARRLRAETAVTLKWITNELHMAACVSNLLSGGKQT